MREGAKPGSPMATERAHKEPFAWWLTKLRIGQDLRERYPVLRELPPHAHPDRENGFSRV